MLDKIIIHLARKNIIKINDEKFLKKQYKISMKKELDITNPKTFNEKLQWLKLNDRNPEYTNMVDKYEAKKYISNRIGDEYIIPTLGVYNKFDDIDFDKLPNKFVIKCTHDSGGVVVCKDKNKLDIKGVKKNIEKCLKRNFYYCYREWPYKDVKPRIIIEDNIGENLTDYRIYCFNSEPRYIYMYMNSSKEDNAKPEPVQCDIYDINWNKADFRNYYLPTDEYVEKPERLKEMLKIAKELSENTKFLRVDFYVQNNRLYVGELTFFPGAGVSKFYPEEADLRLGNMIKL